MKGIPRFLLTFFLSAFVFLLGSEEAHAWDMSSTVGSGMGVHIKPEFIDQAELEKLYKTGFRYVRFSIGWESVETKKLVYDWEEIDELVKKVRQSKLKMVIPLLGGNRIYDGEMKAPWPNTDRVDTRPYAPRDPESIQAYARFAAQAVMRYGIDDIVWEIWNEPDLARFWPPKPDPEKFAVLTDVACQTVRSIAPEAVIVGPALGRVPDQRDGVTDLFLNTFLGSVGVRCLNAISVHPYRHGSEEPEAVYADYAALFGLMARNKNFLPLINTEWGYSTAQMDQETQAAYAMRMRLIDMIWGIPLTIWYEWKDSRSDPKDVEARFGLLEQNGENKLSMNEIEALLPIIQKAKIKHQIHGRDPKDVLLLLVDEKEVFLVGWTLRKANESQTEVFFRHDGQSSKSFLLPAPCVLARGKVIDQVSLAMAGD